MAQTKAPFLSTAAILALALPLAVIMAVREPDAAWMFILAAVFMPIAWLVVETLKFSNQETKPALEDRITLRQSVRSAGLLILIPLGLTVLFTSGFDWINDAWETRILGCAFGLALIVIANAIPKRPTSLSQGGASLAERQAIARFSGRTLMITGAIYILAAFVTPNDLAGFVLSAIAIIGSLLVVGRCLFAMTRAKSQA
ncbi:hypothetical protein [Oceanicaulis sp. MMSF_3324]|uniref:hypothetical protein n=1 Tax=Oceanicaulis sp. MMSF_3324 TaxID=3046702 RepID=UPI00273F38BF|nr:hypothetical protein [Oceanicaulis sp. MMSF_3324]